jgi:hypothetical protein
MKASIRKRLQRLESTASAHQRAQIALVNVTKMPKADRDAYWAGDDGLLLWYGAPHPADCPPGLVHTIVIDSHPLCHGDRDAPEDVDEGDV